jgi:Raf kinase inhibitor-like YbhB/YbcL family protein
VRAVRIGTVTLALALSGCGHGAPTPAPAASGQVGSLTVTSEAFTDGGPIPDTYTCTMRVPGIQWTGELRGARSLAVVVDDPDAPSGDFVHWVVLDLPPSAGKVSGEPGSLQGAHEGNNSEGQRGWASMCPPPGTGIHHYRFTVYALSMPTGLPDGSEPERAIKLIQTRILAKGTLTGTLTAG